MAICGQVEERGRRGRFGEEGWRSTSSTSSTSSNSNTISAGSTISTISITHTDFTAAVVSGLVMASGGCGGTRTCTGVCRRCSAIW